MEIVGLMIALPLMLLNLAGGLISGIALLIQGEWALVAGGLGYALLGPYILSLLMLPAMLFMPLTLWAAKRENTALVILTAVPNIIWTYAVVFATCVFVFRQVVLDQDGEFFHVVWAYAVATGPWSFLARKDRQSGDDASSTLLFFVQLGAISMMVATFIAPHDTSLQRLATWFVPFLALGPLWQLIMIWVRVASARRLGY